MFWQKLKALLTAVSVQLKWIKSSNDRDGSYAFFCFFKQPFLRPEYNADNAHMQIHWLTMTAVLGAATLYWALFFF